MKKFIKIISIIFHFFLIMIFKFIAIIIFVPTVILKSVILIIGEWVAYVGYILSGALLLLLIIGWNELGTDSTAIISRILLLFLIFIFGSLPPLITKYGFFCFEFILDFCKIIIKKNPFVIETSDFNNISLGNFRTYQNNIKNINVTSNNAILDDNSWIHINVQKRNFAFDSVLEKDTYNMLVQEISEYVRIDFHVHLNEIFKITSQSETYFNKLWVCHIDFIIRDKKDFMNILFAVEVDGADAHRNDMRTMINDSFKNKIFNENNIELIRVGSAENANFVPSCPETYPIRLINKLEQIKSGYAQSQNNQ